MFGGKHKPQEFDNKVDENLMFQSINRCRGSNLSRRDDIESLIYIMAYLLNDHKLPWSDLLLKQNVTGK